jgi:predicted RNA-binding protein with PIN domain
MVPRESDLGSGLPYLVDGNNLLGSWGGARGARDGRLEVVRRVAAFCRARNARAILVFDGAPLRADVEAPELGRVSLRFPPPGGDADGVIRGIVGRARRPGELIVVSSDKALYSWCRTHGAGVLRAHEWNRLEQRLRSRGGDGEEGAEKPEREDDVEGWLKIFGGGDPE